MSDTAKNIASPMLAQINKATIVEQRNNHSTDSIQANNKNFKSKSL